MENVTNTTNQAENSTFQLNKNVNKKEKLNITLYLISKTVSLLGTNIYNFALSLYILKITGSGASFAVNVLIGTIPKIVLGPFAGVLADRVDRKKLTVIFDIISGLIVFSLLSLSSIYGLKVIFIYVTGFLLSTINVFYDTSLTSSMPNLVTDEKLMKINSYTTVSMSLSGVLSPVLAGIVYGLAPINLILLVNAISFIISSALEVFINFNFNKNADLSSKGVMTFSIFKKEIKEVLNFVKEQKVIWSLLKYALMINLFFSSCLSVVYPYVVNKVLGMSSTQYGTFQGFYFAGMIITSIIIGNQKKSEMKVQVISMGLAILGIVLMLIGIPTTGLPIFKVKGVLTGYNIILLFTLGAALVVINTPILVTVQRLTPENIRGRVTGMSTTLCSGITPIGIILAGLIIDKVHPAAILLVSGIFIIVSSVHMYKDKSMREI